MGARIYVRGVTAMRQKLMRIAQNAPTEFGRATEEEFREVEMPEVDARTPWKTKNLRSTLRLDGPHTRSKKILCQILSGGVKAPYAVHVHEDPDMVHPHGQWKYLESVMLESRPFIGRRIAARVDLARMA